MSQPQKTGRIRQIPQGKFHGFIAVDGDKNSYFFHKDDFLGHWNDLIHDYQDRTGAIEVSFRADRTPKGPRARDVRRTDNGVVLDS